MYNFSGGTAGKELCKEIAAGTEISLGGMNQEGRIQEGMTREEATREEKTPGEKITGGMTPGEGIPGGTTLIDTTPEGMTLGRMTTRGMFPRIETHIKVNRGGKSQVGMMHHEMKKERATLKGGREEIGKGVNRQGNNLITSI